MKPTSFVRSSGRWALLVFFLGGACVNVPQNPPPGPVIVAEFDLSATPPVVPSPNDLVPRDPNTGQLLVPATPGESAAQREFEVSYLGSLTNFPFETTGETLFTGDLNPASVNAQTVLAFDLGTTALPSQKPVAITPIYDGARRSIVIPPPSGEWTRAHTFAVVLVGGANGLRGAQNEDVIGSQSWALVSSSTPLVTCQDLAAPDCRPTVDVIPSKQTDPALRLADQTANAIELEKLRRLYAPLLDALAAGGLPRENIPLAWTFSIVDAGEATFDPAKNVIPFPNDILRLNGKVNMPNPKTFLPLTTSDCTAPTDPQIQIACLLNSLDGFSTLAPPVSESSNALGAAQQATLSPASLTTSSVGLVWVASQAPPAEKTTPSYTPCLNCVSSKDAQGNPQTSPQQLQWKLNVPLDEQTTYFGYVTSDVVDDQGKGLIANPIFAMLRLTNPLFDGTHSTLVLRGADGAFISDAQAQLLEQIRLGMKPALDGLEQAGLKRTRIALAFGFTTQSESTVLDKLYGYPTSLAQKGLIDTPLYFADATAQFQAVATGLGVPFGAIGKVYIGAMLTPVAVTGPAGTLDPTNPHIDEVSFVLYLPASAAPSSGYPLTIFGHNLTRSRLDSIAIANTLASAGQATIATDVLFHGERSSCTGSKVPLGQSTDDAACADPLNQMCNEDPLIGRCVARSASARAACTPGPTGDLSCMAQNQGRCVTNDQKCEGGDFLRDAMKVPVISGWNLLNPTNPFASRDNLRQQVIDLAQLERVITSTSTGNLSTLSGASFDPLKLGFVGQGIGSIEGALFNAVSPRTTRVALNTPAGGWVQLIMTSPDPKFAAARTALITELTQLGAAPGTPAFDQNLGIIQWAFDPADPANVGYRLTHGVSVTQGSVTYTAPNAGRVAFVQFIEGDQVFPTPSTLALVASANRSSFALTPPSYGCTSPLLCYELTETGTPAFDQTSAPLAKRDAFLLSPPAGTPASVGLQITGAAQTQVATFLATGQLP